MSARMREERCPRIAMPPLKPNYPMFSCAKRALPLRSQRLVVKRNSHPCKRQTRKPSLI